MTILFSGESDVDVVPLIYDWETEDCDPTPEECDLYGQFERLAPTRRQDLWLAE